MYQGVNAFTLDPNLGEFILSSKNIRIPKRGKIYSINEANSNEWDEPTKQWIADMKKRKFVRTTTTSRELNLSDI